MIRPCSGWWSATHDVGSLSPGNPSNELSTGRPLERQRGGAILPQVGLDRPSLSRRDEGEVAASRGIGRLLSWAGWRNELS